MKCEYCNREMQYIQGAYLCPSCDDIENEKEYDSMDKTMPDDGRWQQGGDDVQSDR